MKCILQPVMNIELLIASESFTTSAWLWWILSIFVFLIVFYLYYLFFLSNVKDAIEKKCASVMTYCVKGVRILSFLVHILPHLDWTWRFTELIYVFRLNDGIRTRKTPNTGTFYTVTSLHVGLFSQVCITHCNTLQ